MKEIWKPAHGYEQWYAVSSLGRIKRLARKKRNVSKNGLVYYTWLDERILKTDRKINNSGYENVCFSIDGVNYYIDVHRLVALTFIKNPKNYKTVNHKDGNKRNNNIDNLEWLTYSDNHKHSYKIGVRNDSLKKYSRLFKGENNPKSKLKVMDVIVIRNLLKEGIKQKTIAEAYHISQSQVSAIKLKRNWGSL